MTTIKTQDTVMVGRFTVAYQATEAYWSVQDGDGYEVDGHEDRDDAIEAATDLEADAVVEDREAMLATFRDQIATAAEACDDPAKLQDVLALLGW